MSTSPAGSVQAVLALGLVLVFAIVGVYLVALAANPPTRILPGLTRDQMTALARETRPRKREAEAKRVRLARA